MSTAFVLIKVEPGLEKDVYLALLEIDSITETHVSYGEYDLVTRIDFADEGFVRVLGGANNGVRRSGRVDYEGKITLHRRQIAD